MLDLDWYFDCSRIGSDIAIRGFRNGKEVRTRVTYEPTLYLETHEDYPLKNIYGKSLKPLEFGNMFEAIDFAREHRGSNMKVYGNPNFASHYTYLNFPDNASKWQKDKIRVFNIDIEVTSTEGFPEPQDAAYPVTAICIHDSVFDKFMVWGFKEGDGWSPEKSILPSEANIDLDNVHYVHCESEKDLFDKFRRYWTTFFPHIITGWNVEGFDIPYICNRMERLGMNFKHLSPWGHGRKGQANTPRGVVDQFNLTGVSVVDYMDRYKKNKVQESYRLDHIAFVELGEKKLDYSEVTGLHNLYFENFQKFIDYNIQDVNLVKRLDEKLGLIDAQIMIAFTACLNLDEVNGTVKTWDALIANEMWKEGKVIPFFLNNEGHTSEGGIPGGYVKEPQVGKHGWVMSFDLASLYPHLIMQFNISPETIHEDFQLWPYESSEMRVHKFLNEEDMGKVPAGHSISPSGYAFTNDFVGVIPRLMKQLYMQRKAIKKEMLAKQKRGEDATLEDLQQYVRKIMLNSGYGALTNKYYRWFDKRLGESITLAGQWLIQVAEKNINAWMNKVVGTKDKDYIIAIDTDSNYVSCQALVDKFFSDKSTSEVVDILDKIAVDQIEKAISNGYERAAEYAYCHEQAMFMDREAIASSAVWTAKKRYAMTVWNNEGVAYEKAKVKIQGLEAIRSSTPGVCRPVLIDIIHKILLEDEESVQHFIADFRDEYMSMPIESIAFPRSMNNLQKFDTPQGIAKGTPPHVRGAIVYNKTLQKLNIDKKYEPLKSGEKGKFIYLREPNKLQSHSLSFLNQLPPEFEIEQFVDKEKMFENTVLKPINSIMNPIGWSAEKKNDLLSFFG